MRFAIGAVSLPSMAFAGTAGSIPRVADLVHRHASLRIVAFGSSSTEGVGASSPSTNYPSVLSAALAKVLTSKVEVINRGIGGEDIDDMLGRLGSDILARQPDLVIWQVGSNDPLRGVPLERFDRALRQGIDRIRSAGIDLMLMEPQWCPRLTEVAGSDKFRDAIRRVGNELAIPVVRRDDLMHRWLMSGILPQAQLVSPDGLHMTDRGYDLLGKEVAKEIFEAAKLPPEFPSRERTEVAVVKPDAHR